MGTMMLVDVNIFMDVLRRRKGWEASSLILNVVKEKKIEGYISALTLSFSNK